MWEISENILGDFGSAFYQSYTSPLVKVDKDITTVMKTKECEVELGRPKGSITFSVSGIESKKGFSSLGSVTIGDTISGSGWSLIYFQMCYTRIQKELQPHTHRLQ